MNIENDNFTDLRSLSDKLTALIELPDLINRSNCAESYPLLKPCYLLSKNESIPSLTQYSFFMANPTDSLVISNKKALQSWQARMADNKDTCLNPSNSIPLHSGWVGIYPYPNTVKDNKDESVDTVAEFHYYPWVICLTHASGEFHLLGTPDNAAKYAFELLQSKRQRKLQSKRLNKSDPQLCNKLTRFKAEKFAPSWRKVDYAQAFFKIQDYLKAGDCYQVNLTQPHKAQYTGAPLSTLLPLYNALNPSFGGYFEGKDYTLVSVSPERFISIDNAGRLEAKPIKGTIKRSLDPKQDQALIDDLKNSKKNQAENLMIVDLLRNDLSMSAEPNSVKVEKLFELETHPNVHHLVSTISAQLKAGLTAAVAIENAFPGGSITGAPKKRAMEIIDELEAQPRSLYCGSFGYYSDSGNVDFNILIRSVEFRNQEMTCWGGGGITIDSDCDEEYEESLTKVRTIMDVIESL